jgi:CO/xanthine dehydrogenase Mo-binding subunit
MIEPSALGVFESARVEIDASGRISVTTGCTSQGQGQETTLAQVAAAVFDVPHDEIRVRHGDTGLIAYGGGTNASRAAVMAGNAVHAAAESVKHKAIAVAAKALEVAEQDLALIKGRLEIRGAPGSGLSLGEAARLLQPGDFRFLSSPNDAQIKDNEGLTATSFLRGVPHGTSVFAVHMADVAVDRETGQIHVERYQVVCDVGRALNPMIVEGQIVGGVVQGIGSTLLEELVYDEEGQLQNASLADYLIPTVAEAPRVRAIALELTKSPTNPLGVRGVGEVGPAAVGAAIANAVAEALGPDVRIDRLPLSPERILEMISVAQDSV